MATFSLQEQRVIMVAIFWDSEGVILTHCVPKGTTVRGASYLRGRTFTSRAAIASAIFPWSKQTPTEAFAAAMESWRRSCEKCARLQGDYVEKWQKFQIFSMIIVWEKTTETLELERTTYESILYRNTIHELTLVFLYSWRWPNIRVETCSTWHLINKCLYHSI
jgi:hypothetical protein